MRTVQVRSRRPQTADQLLLTLPTPKDGNLREACLLAGMNPRPPVTIRSPRHQLVRAGKKKNLKIMQTLSIIRRHNVCIVLIEN